MSSACLNWNWVLIFCPLNQKPQCKSKFRNKTNRQKWVRYYIVAWEKKELKKPNQDAKKIDD